MSRYALWKLKAVSENLFIGPEELIKEAGGSVTAFWYEDNDVALKKTLGLFTEPLPDLEDWEWQEISEADAISFIEANPEQLTQVLPDGVEISITAEDVLAAN